MKKILVWDLPLRVFHWLLVTAFIIAYLTEDDWLIVHVWAGYLIAGLLVFRIVWGFMGNHYARFNTFICQPGESINYVKEVVALKAKRYLGHNPAGALMIVFLLTSLLLTTITGIAVYGADQAAGPLGGIIGSANEKLWEEVHEFFANFTVLLIIVHITGVIVESYLHDENLVKSMWNGYKKPTDDN